MARPALSAVATTRYDHREGIALLRDLLHDLIEAANQQSWVDVRRLDRVCMSVLQRVGANDVDDKTALAEVLGEMRLVYRYLLERCDPSAAVM